DAEAGGQLAHHRLPFPVRKAQRMKQRKWWTGARFAVRYAGAIVMVVKPKSHLAWQGHIVSLQASRRRDRLSSRLVPKVVQLLRNVQQRSQLRLKCRYGTNEEQPPRFVNFASRQRTRGLARHDPPLGRHGIPRVLPDPRWTAPVQR